MAERPRAEITTILFTDLVSSTELMQRIGDDRAQRVFQTHHAFLRDTVVSLGGDPVEWTGDGVMATFASVSDAVRCAIAVQRTSPRDIGDEVLRVRVGLYVGEVLRQQTGSGYFGAPVVIARRLCDQAKAGQILCATAVAALLAGSRAFQFRELGKQQLKGIADPIRVSEILYETATSPPPSLDALEFLVQTNPDIIVAANNIGQVVFFNKGAEEILGYSAAEIQGRSVMELYPTPEEARRVDAAIRSHKGEGPGRIANLRVTLLSKDGVEIPVAISCSRLRDETGDVVATIGISKEFRTFRAGE